MGLTGGERHKVDPAIQRLEEAQERRAKGYVVRTVGDWGSRYSGLSREPRKIEPSPDTEKAVAEVGDLVGEMLPAREEEERLPFNALFGNALNHVASNTDLYYGNGTAQRDASRRVYKEQLAEAQQKQQKQASHRQGRKRAAVVADEYGIDADIELEEMRELEEADNAALDAEIAAGLADGSIVDYAPDKPMSWQGESQAQPQDEFPRMTEMQLAAFAEAQRAAGLPLPWEARPIDETEEMTDA